MEIPALNYQQMMNNAKSTQRLNNNTNVQQSTLEAAQEFAQFIYKEFLEIAMPPLEGQFGGGQIEKQLNDMLTDEYAKIMSKAEKSVLTQQIYKDLNRTLNKKSGE